MCIRDSAVPSPASPRSARLAGRGMGRVGKQPPRQVLPSDRGQPASRFEAMQGWEQRAGSDVERPLRDLFDATTDAHAVIATQGEAAKDQEIERAAEQVGLVVTHGALSYRNTIRAGPMFLSGSDKSRERRSPTRFTPRPGVIGMMERPMRALVFARYLSLI